MVKHLPTMQETQARSLGQEDLLEKEMVTHSSTLDWKNPWTEEHGRLQSMSCKESDMNKQFHFHSGHNLPQSVLSDCLGSSIINVSCLPGFQGLCPKEGTFELQLEGQVKVH